jgi:acyl-CoA thioester hydrolase
MQAEQNPDRTHNGFQPETGGKETSMEPYRRKVQYHETDKMGITHHANYIKWMEEARVDLLERIGLPFEKIEAAGIVSPVVGLSIDYRSPCTFGDEIAVVVEIEKYTGVQLIVRYVMKNAQTDMLVATASSRHCFLKQGRAVSLKREEPAFHDLLQRQVEKVGAQQNRQ